MYVYYGLPHTVCCVEKYRSVKVKYFIKEFDYVLLHIYHLLSFDLR